MQGHIWVNNIMPNLRTHWIQDSVSSLITLEMPFVIPIIIRISHTSLTLAVVIVQYLKIIHICHECVLLIITKLLFYANI